MSDTWSLGDLAALDNYSGVDDARTFTRRDPREGLPLWARQAADAPRGYEPETGQVFGGRSNFGAGFKQPEQTAYPTTPDEQAMSPETYVNPVAKGAVEASIPTSPTDLAMTLMPGGIARKAVAGAMGSVFDSSEAEAGKGAVIRGLANAAGKKALKIIPTLGETSVVSPISPSAPQTLFNYSRLNEVPNVSQFDLPRYEPPRGVSERVQALVKNDDVAQKMLQMMQRGREIGGDTFYGTEPLRDAFMQELGRDKGQEKFKRYMDFVSGSSPRSRVPANVSNASYYYVLDAQGKPMPAIGDPNPFPYGHMAQKLHQQNANTIVDGGWDLFKNPKPPSFSENLQGNLRPVTVDAHAFKAPAMLSEDPRFLMGSFKPDKDSPTINPSKMFEKGKLSMEDALKKPVYWASRPRDNEYLAMEDYYKRLAREAGFPEPGVAQASAWSGGGEMTGLGSPAGDPFIRAVENRANITASMMGISPAEALSRFMRGRNPLR